MAEEIKDVNAKIDEAEAAMKKYASKDTVISIGGYEFTPAKLMVAFTIVSSVLGGLYGTFEVYKDYVGMKKKIASYEAPDLSGFDKRLAVIEENRELITEVDAAINKIDAALPTVRDLETGDSELDELAKLAQEKAKDLIDLGMNVEPRFSGVILQTAGVMLGHAITAKQAKLDKKLRMVDLQLKKMRLDQAANANGNGPASSIEGEGTVIDRNSLLAEIMKQQKNN